MSIVNKVNKTLSNIKSSWDIILIQCLCDHCEHCEKKLNTETQLEIHMQSNHEVQNFKCDKCDQYFITDCTMKKLYKICQDFNSDLRHFWAVVLLVQEKTYIYPQLPCHQISRDKHSSLCYGPLSLSSLTTILVNLSMVIILLMILCRSAITISIG